MPQFNIINSATKEPLERLFEDPKEAGAYANQMTITSGIRHVVKPVKTPDEAPVDDSWQKREKARFASGEYLPLRPMLKALVDAKYPLHFAHVSKKDASAIAFTPDANFGIADRQRRRSIRGYLEDYFPNEDHAALIDEHEEFFLTIDLKFATTADEIADVYMIYDSDIEGVSCSCMRHGYDSEDPFDSEDLFDTPVHPTAPYASPDLAIAYVANDEGYTTARALVWPEKKLYTRTYGAASRLLAALKRKGYRPSAGYYSHYACTSSGNTELLTFEGARLTAIRIRGKDNQFESGHKAFIMPYLDEMGYVEVDPNDPKYFRIAKRGCPAQSTTGYVGIDIPMECHCCKKVEYTQSMASVGVTMSDMGRVATTEFVCGTCFENTYYCYGLGSHVLKSVFGEPVKCTNTRHTYSPKFYELNTAKSDRSGDLVLKTDLREVVTCLEPRTIQNWSAIEAASYAVYNHAEVYSCRRTLYSRELMHEPSFVKLGRDSHYYRGVSALVGRLKIDVAKERLEERRARYAQA